MCKFTVVIPTLQRNTDVLSKLIQELSDDDIIEKIILIDNSLKGFKFDTDKLEVVIPKKNLFVNSSWNLGVKLSKTDYVAILNDDILIPKNLFKQIAEKIKSDKNIGLIGLDSTSITGTDINDMDSYPEDTEVTFNIIDTTYKIGYWGSAIFGKKENFYPIPKKMKIWCGDNFLLFNNIKNKKINYQIIGANIKHLGSLSVNKRSEFVLKILKSDIYHYAQIDEIYKQHELYETKLQSFIKLIYYSEPILGTHFTDLHILGRVVRIKRTPINVPFIRNIISVRNEDEHKVLTLLGLRFKFKVKSN